MQDTISDFEVGVLATQARANVARLRDFTTFPPQDEAALDRAMVLLAGMIPGASPAVPAQRTSHAPTPAAPTPAPSTVPSGGEGAQALALLRSAHPTLTQHMGDLNWVTRSGDLHVFRHARTQRSMTFDPATKVVSGTLDNGETSHDAGIVLRVIANL